jgi:hypothetical protein
MVEGDVSVGGAIGTAAHTGERGPAGNATLRSVLLIDCGSTFTKAALVGVVDERYRLLARAQVATTVAAPQADMTRALVEACAQLERITGRPLLHDGRVITPEQDDGAGIDAIALATSVGGPLRLLTTGPGREALFGLVHRAIGSLFVQLDALPPAARPGEGADPAWGQLVAQIRAQHPHGILVVGAPSGGMRTNATIEDAAQTAATWLDALRQPLGDDRKPPALPVVFTGSTEDGVSLAATLRASTPMVHPVEPLSPTTLAPLTRTVSALYENVVLRDVPGFTKVRGVVAVPPAATMSSLGGVIRFLAQQYHMTVVGVDVGASATVLAAATGKGEFMPATFAGGVGAGAGAVLRAAGVPNILRWLTSGVDENGVREYAAMRMLRPRMIATTPMERDLEYAFAREGLRLAQHAPGSRLAGLHPIDVLMGTGGVLANVPHPALAALLLLDALQPRGITSIVIDPAGLATMLGAAAPLAPDLAAEVTESDAVAQLLGSAISVGGMPAAGSSTVRVVLERPDGRKMIEEVAFGSMVRLPLGPGERALLSLYPSATLDVGLGPGQQARASEPIEGGTLGVVVDARGRPLTLPADPVERVARLTAWQRALDLRTEKDGRS